ncbi:hypothetical protein Ping_2584 [Psychromonas ingrahamii 37]|uniref:Uncharacterized protein n=1 Tax=Psychromonas ingrahamii (strain DSM 17664 / CCUG 51855 / 37) TaxID=357804 RepID=A1SXT9_PSYIN|nr:hypothetical protein [Psychromonas ingrahamii]ABM04304.1 hypothetical protein Ping_2584 [Psychromonas ingrahamii 37]
MDASTYIALSNSFREDLKVVVDKKGKCSKNDLIAYFAYELFSIQEFDKEFFDTTLQLLSGKYNTNALEENDVREIFPFDIPRNSKGAYTKLCNVIFCLYANAAKKKIIELPIHARLGDVFTNNPHQIYTTLFSFCLPKIAMDIINISTKARYEKSKELIDLVDPIHDNRKYKTFNKTCLNFAAYLIRFGIDDIKDINVKHLNAHRIEIIKSSQGNLSLKPILGYFDEYYNTDLQDEYIKESYENMGIGVGVKHVKDELHLNYRMEQFQSAKNIAGLLINDQAKVLIFTVKPTNVDFSGIKIDVTSLNNFTPEDQNNKWLLSQNDFLHQKKFEANTKKSLKSKLAYFNAYLFGYLPAFFYKHPETCFKFPSTPEEFHKYVFVEFSTVVDSSINAKELEKIYPMSIHDFIAKVSNYKKNDVTENNNLHRDIIGTIHRYFDYITASFSSLKGFNIKANPIEKNSNIGTALKGSVKQRFDVNYWIRYRLFTKEVCKIMLLDTCNKIEFFFRDASEPYLLSQAVAVRKEVEEFTGIKVSEVEYNEKEKCIYVDREIDLFDGNILKIKKLDYGSFTQRSSWLGNRKFPIKHLDYQRQFNVLLACYAGQRASNGMWLDTDSFDAIYDGKTTEGLVPLYINTDKVNSGGMESNVPYEVFNLLRLVRKIRNFNTHTSFTEGVFYQNNPNSEFGIIKPLLQTTETNSDIVYNLSMPLQQFEACLTDSDLEFESTNFYAPLKTPGIDFLYYKRLNRTPRHATYKIINAPGEEAVSFTPIAIKSAHTIHALRTELVSIFSVLTDDKAITKMFTGQSDETQAYYTTNTPEQELAIREITDKQRADLGVNVISVKDTSISFDEIAKSVVEKTFSKQFGGISNFAPSGQTSGIEEIENISVNEIALNPTHICPYNNICPSAIVREIGEKNCHVCYKAIVVKKHRPAIAATIRMIVDEIKELYIKIKRDGILSSDLVFIQHEILQKAKRASAWKVRTDFLRNMDITGDPNHQFKEVIPNSIKARLLARLKEVDGSPMLQSNLLIQMASRLSRRLMTNMSKMDISIDDLEHGLELNPIKYTLKNLEMLAELEGKTVLELMENTRITEDKIGLELFE